MKDSCFIEIEKNLKITKNFIDKTSRVIKKFRLQPSVFDKVRPLQLLGDPAINPLLSPQIYMNDTIKQDKRRKIGSASAQNIRFSHVCVKAEEARDRICQRGLHPNWDEMLRSASNQIDISIYRWEEDELKGGKPTQTWLDLKTFSMVIRAKMRLKPVIVSDDDILNMFVYLDKTTKGIITAQLVIDFFRAYKI